MANDPVKPLYSVKDAHNRVVAGLKDVPADNGLVMMLSPMQALSSLAIDGTTQARDRLGERYWVTRTF